LLDLLAFALDGERYALPAADVLEVQRAVAMAALPRSPAIVEGVINLRGKLVPVLDIRARLGLPPRPLRPADQLVVVRLGGTGVRGGGRTVAIRVDRALDLLRVPKRLIEDPRPVAGPGHSEGVAKLPDGLVVIHDPRTFLSLDEELQLDGSVTGAAS
jgi:purine-binding chemotaxis protein CheW